MSATAETRRESPECAHCGAPLGADPRTDPATGRAFCCYGCRVLGAAKPAARATDAPPSPPWFGIGAGALVAGQSMVLGLAVNLTPPTGTSRALLHGALIASAAGVCALLGPALLRQACGCARDRRVAVEWLFLAGVAGAFGASLWSTFTGRGAVYYEVVAVLLTVNAAGKALTASTKSRAIAETRKLRDVFALARVRDAAGNPSMVPVGAIEPGDVAWVFAGEAIPVDGVVAHGAALVRETPMTGEALPVARRAGDAVWAGSFSEDGDLAVRATVPGRARRLDGVLAAVERARGSLAGTSAQREADRVAAWFLPGVLGVSAATFAWWAANGRPGEGLFNALSVLLVACPCALGLATPLALWHALASLAARGIVVRSAGALERAAGLRRVFLDKTGTLGEVDPVRVDFVCAGGDAGRARWSAWVRAVQERSGHPLARPFHSLPAAEGVAVHSFRSVPGRGVEAWVSDGTGTEHAVRIGTMEWLASGTAPAWAGTLRAAPGDARVAVSVDGHWVGLGAARERARADAARLVGELHALGCTATLLSGDAAGRVDSMAERLGADAAHGGMLPAGKAVLVRDAGPGVAMVGDGVNDAAALAAADVGFALGGGAALAEATADVVLAGDDLSGVATVIRTARATRRAIRASLGFAAFYNALGMGLAAAGALHPVAAALLMVGSSAVVSWRVLRPAAADCVPVAGTTPWSGRMRWGTALAFGVQAPWIVWLGQLGPGMASAVGVACLALAAWSAWPGPARGWATSHATRGALAMLGVGNLLMLVGWWADAGFGPVMREGVCLCCRSHHYFQVGARIPWMHVGMLAGGLPAMAVGNGAWKRRMGRGWVLVLSAVGMVAGMGFGAEVALRWAGPGHPHQFPLALAGMSAGMMAGMIFACAIGDAAMGVVAERRRHGSASAAKPPMGGE